MAEIIKCPVCKSDKYFIIYASGGEYVCLQNGWGKITLNACVACGCVYVEESVIRNYIAKKCKCSRGERKKK